MESDVDSLIPRLRDEDKREAEAMGLTPEQALRSSYWESVSTEAWSVLHRDQVVAMFGCPAFLVGNIRFGLVWLMGSEGIADISRTFLRFSRYWLNVITQGLDASGNAIDARNALHLRWIEWLGYARRNPHERGGTLFYEFSKIHV